MLSELQFHIVKVSKILGILTSSGNTFHQPANLLVGFWFIARNNTNNTSP